MDSNNVKIRRIGIFSSGFQLLLILIGLYLVFYFSRRYSIPIIGTVAKWILIVILGIFAFFVGIILLVLLIAIFIIVVVFLRNASVKRRIKRMHKKENLEEKIRVLNPSTKKKTSKSKVIRKGIKKSGDVIVDAEYK